MSTARRTTAAALAAVVLGVPATLGVSVALAPAAEASTYRYWSYWWGERPTKPAAWQYASQGPATHSTGDTWVLGWRFATAPESGSAPPRQSASFAALCPGLDTPVAGSVRVALVIDYGSASDAPPGQSPPTTSSVRVECLTLPTTPRVTGSTVLGKAGVPVRSEGGLICALDGYPLGECAPLVSTPSTPVPSPTRTSATPSATPTPTPTRSSTSAPTGAGTSRPTSTSQTSDAARGTAPSAAASSQPGSSPTSGPGGSAATAATLPSAGEDATSTDPVATPEQTLPAASGSPVLTDTGSPAGFALGALAVAGVAGAAWIASRRGGGG